MTVVDSARSKTRKIFGYSIDHLACDERIFKGGIAVDKTSALLFLCASVVVMALAVSMSR
jgi:hypothetical protein